MTMPLGRKASGRCLAPGTDAVGRLARVTLPALILGAALTGPAVGPLPAAAHEGHVHEPGGPVPDIQLDARVRSVRGERVRVERHVDHPSLFPKRPGRARPAGTAFEPAPAAPAPAPAAASAPAPTWCGTESTRDDTANAASNAPQFKVVYAHASDQPNRFSSYANLIQGDVKAASDRVMTESGGTRTIRFDMGTSCGPQFVDITVVRLPNPAGHYTVGGGAQFDRTAADVRAALGPSATVRNYVIYADGLSHPDAAGQGELYADDRPGADNPHNSGGLFAMLWGRGGSDFFAGAASSSEVLVHEVGHNLGAVQDSAPHSTGAGHCNEGHDVMCYSDGGPRSTMTHPCPEAPVGLDAFDCNKDDYFSPSPAAGSYLATHWNTYSSRFTCPTVECGARPLAPVARISADPSSVSTGDQVTLSARDSVDEGQIVRYQWDVDGDGGFERDTGATATTIVAYARAGTYSPSVRVTDADGNSTDATTQVSVADRPPNASFSPSANPAYAPATVTFDGSGSSDPDGRIVRYEWDLDGDGSFELSGQASSASRRYVEPGTVRVTLRVTDDRGNSSQASLELNVAEGRPEASLRVTPNPARTGREVFLSAAESIDPEGEIVRYEWDLDGDGGYEVAGGDEAFEQLVTYRTPGTRVVRLRVTAADGDTADRSAALVVRDGLPPRVAVRAPRGLRLASVLRRGLATQVATSEASTIRVEGVLGTRTARALGFRRARTPVLVARGAARTIGAARLRVRVRLTGTARRRLARARSVELVLRTRATDLEGNVSRPVTTRIRLGR